MTAKSETEIFSRLVAAVHELGFEHCLFGVRIPIPVSDPQFSFQSDYPDAWIARYVDDNYFANDPTVRHALTHSFPLIWSADGQTQNVEFWQEAASYGLRHGCCMPTRSRIGMAGFLTMTRSTEAVDEHELSDKGYRMSWLATAVGGVLSEYHLSRRTPEYVVELTLRERETLKWSAAGKTYAEISKIMLIDERTVKFHLVNTLRKLNALNKTEAAVKAAILGLLF
ncbi:LuxR family transcriptional regulator [Burkholderia sp. Bp8998]|uniref:LuxR family transcriptional regulator n=1 Tax=Burkholderia sp. Bp8998 TaxID=2184557 RepID=UPI0021AB70CA|nr:LuxR family transcriptional regulator [Burkholderia sp. Bp8998]